MRPLTSCKRCGAQERPTLVPGTGPHACKAVCSGCGRFIRWVSLLAPAERLARKMKARLEAMQRLSPSEAQLAYLQALGDQAGAPSTMAEASQRIEELKAKKEPLGSTRGHNQRRTTEQEMI